MAPQTYMGQLFTKEIFCHHLATQMGLECFVQGSQVHDQGRMSESWTSRCKEKPSKGASHYMGNKKVIVFLPARDTSTAAASSTLDLSEVTLKQMLEMSDYQNGKVRRGEGVS